MMLGHFEEELQVTIIRNSRRRVDIPGKEFQNGGFTAYERIHVYAGVLTVF